MEIKLKVKRICFKVNWRGDKSESDNEEIFKVILEIEL